MAIFDPNAWYTLTYSPADESNGSPQALGRSSDETNWLHAVQLYDANTESAFQRWQIVPVSNSTSAVPFLVRSSYARQMLYLASYCEYSSSDDCANNTLGGLRPEPNGIAEASEMGTNFQWMAIAVGAAGEDLLEIGNKANGSDRVLGVEDLYIHMVDGTSGAAETGRWSISSMGTINDPRFSEFVTEMPSTTTSSTASPAGVTTSPAFLTTTLTTPFSSKPQSSPSSVPSVTDTERIGAIAGSILGFFLLAGLAVLFFVLHRKRRGRQEELLQREQCIVEVTAEKSRATSIWAHELNYTTWEMGHGHTSPQMNVELPT